ncbi:type II secretion system protein GspK [Propionivibrio sp.]|uniref:type II secretion system protein GspK n=1 Tax=Propionivibrio sp. TaxID=2212460 RepID=UPI0039E4DD08
MSFLMAVTPGPSLKDAASLVTRRARAHFTSAQDFLDALPDNLRASARTSLYSTYAVESQTLWPTSSTLRASPRAAASAHASSSAGGCRRSFGSAGSSRSGGGMGARGLFPRGCTCRLG